MLSVEDTRPLLERLISLGFDSPEALGNYLLPLSMVCGLMIAWWIHHHRK